MVASYGNLYVEGNTEKNHTMFKVSMLLFSLYGTVCSVCYICLIQDFIPIWVGKQYLMGNDLVYAIIVVFYLRMVTNTVWIYRSAMGLFKEVQYINVAAAVLNIILSIMLGKKLGVSGIIIATAISRLLTSFWYEAKIVYDKLKEPVIEYYLIQIKELIVTIIITVVCVFATKKIIIDGIAGILMKLSVCIVICCFGEYVIHRKNSECRFLINKIKHLRKE